MKAIFLGLPGGRAGRSSSYAAFLAFRVSALSAWLLVEGIRKTGYDTIEVLKQAVPGIPKEITPYYLERIPTVRIIVIMKFIEQLDVRLVHGFEALFIPIGLLAWAIAPFINAALCLMTVGSSLASKAIGYEPNPTTASTSAMAWIGIGEKCSWKVMPSSSLFLNHKILIAFWMMGFRYGY